MEDRIEFDSVITEKALNDFKMYHVFHNVGGVFGYVFAAFAIVMCVLGVIFKMSPKYIVMMGLFGVFFFFYPIVNMRLGTIAASVRFKQLGHLSEHIRKRIQLVCHCRQPLFIFAVTVSGTVRIQFFKKIIRNSKKCSGGNKRLRNVQLSRTGY